MANKWTEEKIRAEVEKAGYKTKKEMSVDKALYCAAYRCLTNNGMRLIDCLGFEELLKPNGYWAIYENNVSEALKYTYLCDFKKYGGGAYNKAVEYGWIHEYTWLLKKKKDIGYWNDKEKCREAAKQCKNVKAFSHTYPTAFNVSVENGWVDEFYPGRRKKYLTYDYCFDSALKYKTVLDLRDSEPNVYNKASKKGWLKDYEWLTRGLNYVTDKVYSVYVYIDREHRIVYVGLTSDRKRRDTQHRNEGTPVYKAFHSVGIEIPLPIYFCGDKLFNQKQALFIEDSLVSWFKRIGFNVINKGKTGVKSGSVGAVGKRVSNAQIVECASHFTTVKEFREGNHAMYDLAYSRNILYKLGLVQERKDSSVWEDKIFS